jgi:hypothetical protein
MALVAYLSHDGGCRLCPGRYVFDRYVCEDDGILGVASSLRCSRPGARHPRKMHARPVDKQAPALTLEPWKHKHNRGRRTAQHSNDVTIAPLPTTQHNILARCIISYCATQHSTITWPRWTRTRLLTRCDELHVICCWTITTSRQLSSLLPLTYPARDTPHSSQCWPHRNHAHSLALAITSAHPRFLLRTHPSNHQLCYTQACRLTLL